MIAQLTGTIASIGATSLVLDVGGVGYFISATPNTTSAFHAGETAKIFTCMVVREDAMNLYGFTTTDERDMFEICRSASGVGPRLALAITSVLSPDDFAQAVRSEDVAKLCAVPGIGKKSAQKIVIELKDKVLSLSSGSPDNGQAITLPSAAAPWKEQVVAGLESLGWSTKDAEAAYEAVVPMSEDDPDISVAALMKAALASLARA